MIPADVESELFELRNIIGLCAFAAEARRVLEEDCQLLTQRLALLHGLSAAEVSDKSVFASFVANLLDSELLREDSEGLLRFDEHLLGPLAYAELVLPADARQAIRRIARHPSQ